MSKVNASLSDEELHALLKQRYECFVLISCGKPTPSGKIEVQMVYEGDDVLAAYLLESARMQQEVDSDGDAFH